MRNPVFKAIEPNYRRRVLEVRLQEGRRSASYVLPFSALRGIDVSPTNRLTSIRIDAELGRQAATLRTADGATTDLPADFVLYYCDPGYDWSPINQLKRAVRERVYASKLSWRVLADALETSPTQVMRLLEPDRGAKQLVQLFKLAELAGYHVTLSLKKRPAPTRRSHRNAVITPGVQ